MISGYTEARTKTLVVIAGPTASGKTEAAIRLALELGTEILSADSRQFYREMIIGTARPSEEQLRRVTHHLVGHRSIHDGYNVAMFESDVLNTLEILFRKNDVAILAGGSGLYIDTVCKGIDILPDTDAELRANLKLEYASRGLAWLQQRLLELDPEYHSTVDRQNPIRLMRGIEVSLLTGRPYSSFRKRRQASRSFRIKKYGLDVPREELYRRINLRTDRMMNDGLLEEATSLLPFRTLNALNTVGYKELFEYLEGNGTLEEAVERIKLNTRRYAKRQMTWFRRDPEIRWVAHPEELAGELTAG